MHKREFFSSVNQKSVILIDLPPFVANILQDEFINYTQYCTIYSAVTRVPENITTPPWV